MPRTSNGIPLRPLGRTGEWVTCICLGGGHIARGGIDEAVTVRVVQEALDNGINFLDNAWEYGGGESEVRFGKALRGRPRDSYLLMTKVCARDKAGATAQLEDSLRKLGTDHIDLWQFHECNYDNDADWITAPGGALEAAVEAKRQGKIRYIGFTGHKSPHIHQAMLDTGFSWDACQFPLNVCDHHFRSFEKLLLPKLNERGIGSLAMKSLGGEGQLIRTAGLSKAECRRYVLSLNVSTLVVGVQSSAELHEDLAIARGFVPYTAAEMDALRAKAKPFAGDGRHEWFKTTQYFDSKVHRDQHEFPPVSEVS